MAKSSRSTTNKVNNQRLKKNVFGPVESARIERLSKKLLDIASQPKPESDAEMKLVEDDEQQTEAKDEVAPDATNEDVSMDVDSTKSKSSGKKGRVEKRKSSKMVFPTYKDRVQGKKKRRH